jgi:DNA (cytosine-5)-methyltransferase 1
MMNVLDLFSGIGGFSLGLERTGGFRTVAFCEIDPYCRRVLAKHWPDVPVLGDVRIITRESLAATLVDTDCNDGGARRTRRPDPASKGQCFAERPLSIDVICGGFPCQDISVAGKGAGLAGSRSGLWKEYARIIGEVRPRYVIVENVSALLSRGLGDVLGDLAALGYDAEWHCIPASAVGAPHRRDRIWIVAYADCGRWQAGCNLPRAGHGCAAPASGGDVIRDADGSGLAIGQSIRRNDVEKFAATVGADWWAIEPDVGRVAHGVPARVDRLRALGNAVVPQIPEIIGRAILAAEVQP